MSKRKLMGAAIALTLPISGAARQASAPANVAPPNARWAVNASEDACSMARQVAAGPTTFVVTRYPGADYSRMRIVAPKLPNGLRSRDKARVTLSPGDFSHEAFSTFQKMPATRDQMLEVRLPSAFLDKLAAAASLKLSVGRREIVAYDLPQTAAVARVFARCEADALVGWGADPAGLEPGAIRAKAVGTSDAWINDAMQPVLRQRGDGETDVVHRLNVAVDGRVDDCTLLHTNLHASKTDKLCETLLKNARYEPARNRQGKPVRAVAIHDFSVVVVTTITVG